MIWANLFRRKGRTFLTLLGISIGVAAIIALGAMAGGLREGFSAMTQGSQANLVLSQANTTSSLISSVEEAIADDVRALPEVSDANGMLFTNALIDDESYLFILGHEPDGFAIDHFRVIEGQTLAEARGVRGSRFASRYHKGKPLILGRRTAQSIELGVGDVIRITGSVFRVVGIYETGSGFEDGGSVVPLEDAQALALQPHDQHTLYVGL